MRGLTTDARGMGARKEEDQCDSAVDINHCCFALRLATELEVTQNLGNIRVYFLQRAGVLDVLQERQKNARRTAEERQKNDRRTTEERQKLAP